MFSPFGWALFCFAIVLGFLLGGWHGALIGAIIVLGLRLLAG